MTKTLGPGRRLAAHEFFEDDSAKDVESALENWIDPHLAMNGDKIKVVIFIDEIQYLDLKEFIELRFGIHCYLGRRQKVSIQLIVSGATAVFLPVDLVPLTGEFDTSLGGLKVINLRPLNREDSFALLNEFIRSEGRLELSDDFLNLPSIQHVVQLSGGNARLIEFIAANISERNNFQQLHDALMTAYEVAYPFRFCSRFRHAYTSLIDACFTQVPVRMDYGVVSKNYSTTMSVRTLIGFGIAVYNTNEDADFYDDYMYGYFSIPLFELYMFSKKLRLDIPYRILEPKEKWTWSDFEWFIGELVTCRLNAFFNMKYTSVSLRQLLGGLDIPNSMQKMKIDLGTFSYHELAGHNKSANDIETSLPSANFAVVRNGNNHSPFWDVAVYTNKSIALAIQVKHSGKIGPAPITPDLIKAQRQKVSENIPVLFITDRPMCKDLKFEVPNTIVALKEDLPKLLGVFKFYEFTNDNTASAFE